MVFFDDIFGQPFGGMFDFNGDGKTDLGESWIGHMIINECMKKDQEQDDSFFAPSPFFDSTDDTDDDWKLYCEDGSSYGIDPDDYSSEFDYEEALEQAKSKVEWRETCEDGLDYNVDPDDFDDEEDYQMALEEAKENWHSSCEEAYDIDPDNFESDEDYQDALELAQSRKVSGGINIPITLSFSFPGQEALDKIKPENYPNIRQYKAAYHLCNVEQGTAFISSDSSKAAEIKKCKFILDGTDMAGRYLTVYDGFLLAQAIKENFELPIEVPDEDEEVKTYFDDLFLEIAEEDVQLALKIWVWCIDVFGPYKSYLKNDWSLYNAIISSVDDYPKEFLDIAVKELGNNTKFCQSVLAENPQFPHGIAHFIVRALELELYNEAQVIITASAMNKAAKGKDIENLVNRIISDCSNWEELETMEGFKLYLLPIIKKMNNKRIQRLLPKFYEEVDHYIDSVESSEEKYQFSRRNSWRNKYKDGSGFDLDPVDYKTETEYNEALQREKYGWRRWHSEAKRYGIDVNTFETEEEYNDVLRQKRAEEQAACSIPRHQPDPLATTDKTIFGFCSVVYNASNQPYNYLTGDIEVKIGDKVIVPIGNDGKEVVATVVSTSQHMRLTAPYPVDKAKRIIRVIKEDNSEN